MLFEKIRRCGLIGGCVAVGFDISKACARPSLTLPMDQDIELSATCPVSHLPAYYHMLPAMMIPGTVSQLNAFIILDLVIVSLHSNRLNSDLGLLSGVWVIHT